MRIWTVSQGTIGNPDGAMAAPGQTDGGNARHEPDDDGFPERHPHHQMEQDAAPQRHRSDGRVVDILLDPQDGAGDSESDPFATSGSGSSGAHAQTHAERLALAETRASGRSSSESSAMSSDLLSPGAAAAGSPMRAAAYPLIPTDSQTSFADFSAQSAGAPQRRAQNNPYNQQQADGQSLVQSPPQTFSAPSLPSAFASASAAKFGREAEASVQGSEAPPDGLEQFEEQETPASLPPRAATVGPAVSGSGGPVKDPRASASARSSFGAGAGGPDGLPPRPGAGLGSGKLISPLMEERELPTQSESPLDSSTSPTIPPQLAAVRSRLHAQPPPLEPHLFSLPTRRWTDPTSFLDVPFVDRLSDAISRAFAGVPFIQRPVRRIISVDQAIAMSEPYKALIEARSWRALAQIARCDIIASHPVNVAQISRLWLIRWYALARLKFVDIIQSEMDRIGDLESPELTYERYPDIWPGRRGPLASFELRMFCHLVPAMKGNHYESIHKMYKLLYAQRKLVQHDDPESVSRWQSTQALVLMHVANLLAQIQDYAGAATIMEEIVRARPVDDLDTLAVFGRLYLQIGELPRARNVFLEIERRLGLSVDKGNKDVPSGSTGSGSTRTSTTKATITTPLPTEPDALPRPDLVLSHRGFLHIAEGEFHAAASCFTDLVTRLPSQFTAINNLAICQLYSGNVNQAASFLESLTVEAPGKSGACEEFVFNLCTIYDLMDHCTDKKRRLLTNVVVPAAGDDFASESLKL